MAFKKGQSGNPGARPKVIAEIRELARAHTGEAIEALVDVLKNGKNEPARISAANSILAYAYGKPSQSLEHRWRGGGPIDVSKLTDEELR